MINRYPCVSVWHEHGIIRIAQVSHGFEQHKVEDLALSEISDALEKGCYFIEAATGIEGYMKCYNPALFFIPSEEAHRASRQQVEDWEDSLDEEEKKPWE